MAKQTPPAPQEEQPQPSDVVAEKKRRKWPWVLVGIGGIAAIIVVTAVSTGDGGGRTGTEPASPDAPDAPGAPGEAVPTATVTTYEIEGESEGDGDGSAMVTYTADENLSVSQENGVALPWTKTVDLGEGTVFGGASLTAQGDASVTSITCRVIRDGEAVSENTSTGRYAVVSCF